MKEKIKKCWSGEILWNCPMSKFSTLRVGGNADAVILPAGLEELSCLVKKLSLENVPWRVIGRGSNILFSSLGVEGVVIVLDKNFSAIKQLLADEQTADEGVRRVYAESGCSMAKMSNWCIENEIAGFEFASGIPGSLGGAIVMNAGAWGQEICNVLESVTLMDCQGRIHVAKADKKDFFYRRWKGRGDNIVAAAIFSLKAGTKKKIKEKCKENNLNRSRKQPQGVPSAGSFFVNPEGDAAGRLIEKAGLKGLRVGGAQVSPVHANFFINAGNAVSDDFFRLMKVVQEKVRRQFGVKLSPEVEFVGKWQNIDEISGN